jgi:hypothetical protein
MLTQLICHTLGPSVHVYFFNNHLSHFLVVRNIVLLEQGQNARYNRKMSVQKACLQNFTEFKNFQISRFFSFNYF